MNSETKIFSIKNFVYNILKYSISSWTNFAISILSTIITTRIFAPEIYGKVNLFNTTSSLLMGIITLGLDSSYMRFYHDPPKGLTHKHLFAISISLPIIFLILIFALISIYGRYASFFLFGIESQSLLYLLGINCFSLLILNFFSLAYRMSNNAKLYTIQSVLVQLITKTLIIVAVFYNPSFEVIIFISTIGIFVLTVVLVILHGKSFLPKNLSINFRILLSYFRYAFFSWPVVILIFSNSFVTQMIISKLLGAQKLGIFASTGFFISALLVIQSGFKTYWAPYMYKNYEEHQSSIINFHDYIMIITILIFVSILILQNQLYSIIGFDYRESRLFFSLVILSPLLGLIQETTSYGITIAKKNQYILSIFTLSTLVNVALSLILVKEFELVGIGFALVISELVKVVLSTVIGQIYYKSLKSLSKTLLSILMLVVIAILNVILIENYTGLLFVLITYLIFTYTLYRIQIHNTFLFLIPLIKNRLHGVRI